MPYKIIVVDDALPKNIDPSAAKLVPPDPTDVGKTLGDFFVDTLIPALSEIHGHDPIFLINVDLDFPGMPADEQAGVELLKHIRYTREYDVFTAPFRFAPVVMYSYEPASGLLGRKRNNLILHSPGVTFLQLPAANAQLGDSQFFERLVKKIWDLSREDLLPFVVAGDPNKLERVYKHDYRNKVGAIKFLEGFAGDLYHQTDPLRADYIELKNRELGIKELTLLHEELISEPEPADKHWVDFRAKVAGSKFLYVDDEHHWGWSTSLYSGLFGIHLSETERPNDRQTVQAVGNDFTVVSSAAEAEKLINGLSVNLDQALKQWVHKGIDSAILNASPFDAVFLDLRIEPEKDRAKKSVREYSGAVLLKRIRALFPTIPVILMTASEKAASFEAVLSLGARYYWMKGIDTGLKLRSVVKQALQLNTVPVKGMNMYGRWVGLRKLAQKKEWVCYGLSREALRAVRLDLNDSKRKEAEVILEACFSSLLEGEYEDVASPPSVISARYRGVMVDLGGLQELRYHLSGEQWNVYAPEECSYRERRNSVVHRGARGDRQEALSFFDYTLQSLLSS